MTEYRQAHVEKEPTIGKWSSLISILRSSYDADKKEFLGRTRFQWGRLVTMYACFYLGLGAFNVCIWMTWSRIILNLDDPIYSGDDGLAYSPGVSHIPILDQERKSTLIRYRRSNRTQTSYIRDLMYESFLSDYEPDQWTSENGNFIDCTDGRTDPDPEKVCEFKLDYIRPCVYEDFYGWFEGFPCMILKLNRINNWEPENYESIDEVPEEIKDIWRPNLIVVKCFGTDEVSKERLGPIDYYPEPGWSFDYFPFMGQQGYKSPLVAIRFQALPHRSLLFVTCKAYTKNMVHHDTYRLGLTKFEIMSD
ncbi:sodium/potassium-transporting ATPase subunit beta-1-like [Watersipora subatra]|uniref:sodium/potassium-transporting ATPase subunit beta-1-like n=1 Tax=Watersipora subatra TaxID=2589382 RepID=UPI00355BB421